MENILIIARCLDQPHYNPIVPLNIQKTTWKETHRLEEKKIYGYQCPMKTMCTSTTTFLIGDLRFHWTLVLFGRFWSFRSNFSKPSFVLMVSSCTPTIVFLNYGTYLQLACGVTWSLDTYYHHDEIGLDDLVPLKQNLYHEQDIPNITFC